MPIYRALKYIKNGEGYVSYSLTINKEYKCKMIHPIGPQYLIKDDKGSNVIVSGRMRKRFFKGII